MATIASQARHNLGLNDRGRVPAKKQKAYDEEIKRLTGDMVGTAP
jgi:hypothetical protein